MADYNKFDARIDALVMEARTVWGDDLPEMSGDDKKWLADALHAKPALASHVDYNRSHTGFTREITVTTQDIERVYRDRMGE